MGEGLKMRKLQLFWQFIRHLSGDDAYERYLKHFAERHQPNCIHASEQPLTKKAFFKHWQDEKWDGVKRCC
jgi:uncharacterized short protein YbdD (DUF466 family)